LDAATALLSVEPAPRPQIACRLDAFLDGLVLEHVAPQPEAVEGALDRVADELLVVDVVRTDASCIGVGLLLEHLGVVLGASAGGLVVVDQPDFAADLLGKPDSRAVSLPDVPGSPHGVL